MRWCFLLLAVATLSHGQPMSRWRFDRPREWRQFCEVVVRSPDGFVLLGSDLNRHSGPDSDALFCLISDAGTPIVDTAYGQDWVDEGIARGGRSPDGNLYGIGAYGDEGVPSTYSLTTFDDSGGLIIRRDLGILFDPEFGVDTTSDGGFIIGHKRSHDTYGTVAGLIRLNSDGDTLWTRTLDLGNQSYHTYFSDVVSLRDGCVAAGYRFHDILIAEFDGAGDTVRTRTYDFIDDWVDAICRADNGGYLIGGYVQDWIGNGVHKMVMRLSDTGDSLWSWVSPDSERYGNGIKDVIPTIDSGFVAVGTSNETRQEGSGTDIVLLKFAVDGELEWRGIYGEYGGYEEGNSVVQTDDGGFAIGGIVSDSVTATDFLLIRTERDPSLDARPGPPRALNFRLDQNYPNPFNAITTITFNLEWPGAVNLSIFDLMGRRVRTLLDETVTAGEHQIQFTATGLPSGVYIYRIVTADHTTSRKLLLLK